jgi:hypothetical protein
MAQEANTQNQTQTIRLRKTYRDTEYGGFTKTYVLTPDGKIIKPVASERSGSGNHGFDEWALQYGRYVIVTINRPNIRNGPKPFEVRLQCVEYTQGEERILNSAGLYVMRVSMSNLKEWALSICP